MKKFVFISILVTGLIFLVSCKNSNDKFTTLKPELLKDKIAGGWAGKMIGVTYGAPTEFRAQGKTYEDSIKWIPSDIKGSMWQDDIYVQLTFLMSMDKYGIDAPSKKISGDVCKSRLRIMACQYAGKEKLL
jgi:hypothetical protein